MGAFIISSIYYILELYN